MYKILAFFVLLIAIYVGEAKEKHIQLENIQDLIVKLPADDYIKTKTVKKVTTPKEPEHLEEFEDGWVMPKKVDELNRHKEAIDVLKKHGIHINQGHKYKKHERHHQEVIPAKPKGDSTKPEGTSKYHPVPLLNTIPSSHIQNEQSNEQYHLPSLISVYLLNDDVHTFNEVFDTLTSVLHLPEHDINEILQDTHDNGECLIYTGQAEPATLLVEQLGLAGMLIRIEESNVNEWHHHDFANLETHLKDIPQIPKDTCYDKLHCFKEKKEPLNSSPQDGKTLIKIKVSDAIDRKLNKFKEDIISMLKK